MKRKIINIIFQAVLAMLLAITVCAEDIIHEGTKLERINDGYTSAKLITKSPVSPSISHIVVEIANTSSDEEYYIALSDSFYLQRLDGDEWVNVEMIIPYEPRESSLYFGGGASEQRKIPIRSAYGELAEGRYRIIIPMSAPNGSYIDCEFYVSKNGFKYEKEDEYNIKAPNASPDSEDIVEVEFVGIEIDYPKEPTDVECER